MNSQKIAEIQADFVAVTKVINDALLTKEGRDRVEMAMGRIADLVNELVSIKQQQNAPKSDAAVEEKDAEARKETQGQS